MREQKKKTRRHISPELVEEILLNLPIKSLLRFSAVSKSWRELVLGGEFVRKYRRREMIVLRVNSSGEQISLACPLSSLSTDNASPFNLPFEAAAGGASCGELRCFEIDGTLCLYNPSTRAWRKLPAPSRPPRIGATISRSSVSVYAYGLGYDSSTDDYKILKVCRDIQGEGLKRCRDHQGESELYSLRRDGWRTQRKIQTQLYIDGTVLILTPNAVFVGQTLHWLFRRWSYGTKVAGILTFDVSTEKYGLMKVPKLMELVSQDPNLVKDMDVLVLRGKLSVCMNYRCKFVVWVMEDYGSGVWKKDLEIDYGSTKPLCYSNLKPLYFYNGGNGRVIKAVTSSIDNRKLFYCKDEEEDEGDDDGSSSSRSRLMVNSRSFGSAGYDIVGSFTYVESLVSPFPYTSL